MIRILPYIVTTVVCCFILMSCEALETPGEVLHPLDPTNPDFVPPLVVFNLGPFDGETIDTSTVTFEWTGNEISMNFSYRLDDQTWSEWSSDSTISFELLDEGEHIFEIKSKYFNGAEIDQPQSITFTVDDLEPSSITFFPRVIAYDGVFDATNEIFVHEVTDLAMVKAVIRFDATLLEVNSVQVYESQSFLAENGGTIIPFYSIDNVRGEVKIEVAVAGGDSFSVSGTGAIARLFFRLKSAIPVPLYFDVSSEYRNPDNIQLEIRDFGHGGVYAE